MDHLPKPTQNQWPHPQTRKKTPRSHTTAHPHHTTLRNGYAPPRHPNAHPFGLSASPRRHDEQNRGPRQGRHGAPDRRDHPPSAVFVSPVSGSRRGWSSGGVKGDRTLRVDGPAWALRGREKGEKNLLRTNVLKTSQVLCLEPYVSLCMI